METTAKQKRIKLYYIEWRGNPQLKYGGYYKAYGQLSKTEANKKEKTVYGTMTLIPFKTEEEYNDEINRVKQLGYSVR